MPFKIVRNDITKMNTEAIVNTASDHAFITPGFKLQAMKTVGLTPLILKNALEKRKDKHRNIAKRFVN